MDFQILSHDAFGFVPKIHLRKSLLKALPQPGVKTLAKFVEATLSYGKQCCDDVDIALTLSIKMQGRCRQGFRKVPVSEPAEDIRTWHGYDSSKAAFTGAAAVAGAAGKLTRRRPRTAVVEPAERTAGTERKETCLSTNSFFLNLDISKNTFTYCIFADFFFLTCW